MAAPTADTLFGREYSIRIRCIIFCVGVTVQITALYPHWYQVIVGRILTGLSIGALSVLVPVYQGENSPTHIRGIIIRCY